ncbi:MAG: type II toxin-antitoxin system VapC family toxin [Chloroflexota bacterium]
MILLDTDVMIDVFRNYPPAVAWLRSLGEAALGIPGLVAMELIQGCRNKEEQQRVEKALGPYQLFWPTQADCTRAYHDYVTYHLSHNIGILDALIAETAVGMSAEMATFNDKHYRVVKDLTLVQPYSR